MDTTQKSDLRPDVEQNGDEMVCRDCKFYRYAYCDLLQIPTAATFESCNGFARRPA